MDREKEIERMVGDICNYVRSKGVTSVSVVANSPYIKYLHNTGIAEWLIEKGYGDVRAALKEFAESVKMAFYYEFDELIPSTMADKIDELVKEVCGDEPNDDRLR